MVAKAFFVFCASALLVQSIAAECIGNNANYLSGIGSGNSWGGFRGNGFQGNGFQGFGGVQGASVNGGGLTVSSSSPLAPTGVTVVSDNAIEGPVEIAGQLPVMSAVTLEGQLSTGGAAGTTYSCGNGEVGISADSLNAAGVGAGNAGLSGFNGIGAGNAGLSVSNGIGAGNACLSGFNGIGAGINGIGAGINGNGLNGIGSAGLNAGFVGSRISRPGCGGNY